MQYIDGWAVPRTAWLRASEDWVTDNLVAIKEIAFSSRTSQAEMDALGMEIDFMQKCDHPNIVRIFDFGIDDGTKVPYIAMEYLEGGDLSDSIESIGAMTERESCRLLAQVAKALVATAASVGLLLTPVIVTVVQSRGLPAATALHPATRIRRARGSSGRKLDRDRRQV